MIKLVDVVDEVGVGDEVNRVVVVIEELEEPDVSEAGDQHY